MMQEKCMSRSTSTCNMSTDMTDEGMYTTVRGAAIDS